MSKYKYIIVEIEKDVATVTFNRPEKKNSMSPDLHAEMCVALDEVAAAKVKVMVLTGAGNAFVGGMDLEKCFFDNWDDPDKFDPSRFEPTDKPKKDRPFFPFSLGPRRCLGEYFSFLEMKVHIGLLLPRFRMQLVDDKEPELELGINLRATKDIYMKPTER